MDSFMEEKEDCGCCAAERKKTGLTFEEALKAMREGKRVKRPGAAPMWFEDGMLIDDLGNVPLFMQKVYDATDWEIV